ncbi:rhomboid-domain-containing protein [Hyaloscypha variabilis F]|uniref:Rhomboid-domain-containing protein n=1 Tax=Hyaloscypha variabilis (strain UAMH 11265 / GT02V1 / F) TaxID=1149755 RepID=A0A2J6R556_HYAVF|nr:rhomboid-domain-containing protein [Hyaloscypha variabilis F]
MFRCPSWRNATCRLFKAAPRVRARGKEYSTQGYYNPYQFSLPPVRVLGPTLWVFTAAGTIYLGCATYEVYQDVQEFKKQPRGPLTYDSINAARMNKGNHQSSSTMGFEISDVFTTPWSNLNSAEKMLVTATALNVGIYGACRIPPHGLWQLFAHVPAGFRNFTLFSSMFGHSGLLHLGVNMYALSSFGPSVAASPTFRSSGAHLTAFYLSSGLMASLTYHLATIWPNKMSRLSPSLGASGAIMAILGAWAMNYPEGRIGIILIPGSLPADQALLALLAFETWGTFIGYGSWLRLGHAAHLGGLLVGAGYVMYDGKNRLWQPARKFAFNQMQRLKMV